MLVMRFNRVGRKNHPQYRIVVQEKTAAPSGRHTAMVGSYDPHAKVAVLKKEEIEKYLGNGVQPSDSVYNLLVREGIIQGEKRVVKLPEKKVEEQPAEETPTEETSEEKTEEEPTEEKEEKAEEPKEETKEPARKASPSDVGGEAPAKEEKAEESTKNKEKAEATPEEEKKENPSEDETSKK